MRQELTRATRALIVFECVLCFGPAALLLTMAVFLLPVQLMFLGEEPLSTEGPMLIITSVIGGFIGMATLLFVLMKLFLGEPISRPIPVLAAVVVVYLLLLKLMVGMNGVGRVVIGLPILASAHILFLSRDLLFPTPARLSRSLKRGDVWILLGLVLLGVSMFIRTGYGLSSKELLEQRAAWSSRRPAGYEYVLWPAGRGVPRALGYLPQRTAVQGDRVISVSYVISDERPPPRVAMAWTMDTVFDTLLKAQSQGYRVRARFNERWSYVEQAFIETGDLERDWNFEVRDFRADAAADPRALEPAQATPPAGNE